MSFVKFNYGTETQVSAAPITEGYIYYVTDKHAMAYDLNGKRSWIKNDMVLCNTTEEWNSNPFLKLEKGIVAVYSDGYSDENGNYIPAIKISDGKAYLIDQPFITKRYDDLLESFNSHVANTAIHLTAAEKEFLTSSAIGCDYKQEVLIFNTYN